MQTDLSQKNGPREDLEAPKKNALKSVIDRNRMAQVRREIGLIADRSFRDNLISDEAYDGYRKLAEGREEHEIGADMLESTRAFASEHERKAIRIHQKIQTAISKKFASEKDEEFLMENLVTENMKFVSQAEAIEVLIDSKLMRMKKDKERYDQLAGHELIEDVGYLKVDGNTKIDFPDEEEFLELTVPERRELLKKLEEALPKAEAFRKECDEEDSGALIASYTQMLNAARDEGVIGKHTYDKFLSGFRKIDHDEKNLWLEEFENEMDPYKTLWAEIRGTLQGAALAKIEGMIDLYGDEKLGNQFELLKLSESQRLLGSYTQALEKYREKGMIGRHTMTSFMDWMNQQDLSSKYSAEGLLSGEIEPYETLWVDISELGKKEQDFMRSKIDVWGYSELDEQYKAFQSGETALSDTGTSNPLSKIDSSGVKNAIIDTDEMLADQGPDKRKSFMSILGRMFSGANRDAFDATSFETELRNRVAKDNPHIKRDPKGRGADDEVDFYQITEDAEILEETGKAAVIEDNGFVQVESEDQEGTIRRETQVTMNEEDGMRRLMSEESKQNYRSQDLGGNDEMSLAIYSSGRTYELNLRETQVTLDYIRQKDQEELNTKA